MTHTKSKTIIQNLFNKTKIILIAKALKAPYPVYKRKKR